MTSRLFSSKWTVLFLAALSVAVAVGEGRAQYGVLLSGTGPVNRSMGGVGTAAPLSASGALFWNPATIPGLERSELEAGAELLFPHSQVTSSVSGNAFGPGIPPGTLTGTTNSDRGAFTLPVIGLAYIPVNIGVSSFFGPSRPWS